MTNLAIKLLPGALHYSKGRLAAIDMIVVHIMEGSMAGTLAHFRDPNAKQKVSAHYGISLKGEVVRYVADEDTAWANGVVRSPTAELVKSRPGQNPNAFSLSIENEGFASEEPPAVQLASNVQLLRLLAGRHRIPLDRRHIVGHNEIRADKTCPGNINVDALVKEAHGVAEITPRPRAGDRVWSDYYGQMLYVTHYVDDELWYFAFERRLRQVELRSTVPFSSMPKQKGA